MSESAQDDDARYEDPPLPPIRPNMLLVKASGVSSTFAGIDVSHSVFSEVRFFNTRIHQSNFEGSAFNDCDLDGAIFTGCSLRAVQFVDCDVDRIVVNGINVGNLLRLLAGSLGER